MKAMLAPLVALALVALVSATPAQEATMARLTIAPQDFAELAGGRIVDAERTPSGKAVLIDEVNGSARAILKLGEGGDIPLGLYYIKVLFGTDDGTLKWTKVQVWLNGDEGGWFTGFVRPAEAGKLVWREIGQPLPLNRSGELVVEVCSRGDSDFYIGQVVLERTSPYWPKEMMSDEAFFGGLDRNFPGLEKVFAACDAGDYERACSELVAYLRATPRKASGRLGGVLASGPAAKTDKEPSEIAKLLLEDKMILEWNMSSGYCTQEEFKIPPTVFSFADPHEWHKLYDYPGKRWYGWNISENFKNLASAYQSTGDPRFACKAMDLVKRWIDEWGPFPKAFYYEGGYPNQYYTKGSAGQSSTAPSWNRSSGVRHGFIEALWEVLKATGGCEQISDRERIEALKLALLMTRYVQNIRDYANGVHPKNVWLLEAGNWLPEFTEVADMSENGLYALTSFLDYCHYPDGAYFELCYYRHGMFAEAARIAADRGLDVSKYLQKFRPTFDLNVWLTKPMGNFPWINDAGQGKQVDPDEPVSPGCASLGLKTYPDDPYLKYACTFGKEGEPPQPTSRNFPWCGFMIMRTGWGLDDLHLVFDGGRSTGSHQHQDQMNIVLSAYGSTLLCDDGYVGTGFRASDRTNYISHPRGHNLLKVDDLRQTGNSPSGQYLEGWRSWGDQPLDNYWLSTGGYDYAETQYDRPYYKSHVEPQERLEEAKQQRRVLFLKPQTGTPYWVLYDIVQNKGEEAKEHNLQLLFHFTPTSSGEVVEDGKAVRNTAERAGLLILPRSDKRWDASIVNGDARPEENYWQGFVSGGAHNPLVPNDCAIFEYDGTLPAAVATVLYPYPNGGEKGAEAELVAASAEGVLLPTDKAFGLIVSLHDGKDTIAACAEPGTMVKFGELTSDGRIAVVRRDAAGKIKSLLLVEGTVLRVGDKTLVSTGERKIRYLECGVGPAVKAEGVKVAVDGLSLTGVEWTQ